MSDYNPQEWVDAYTTYAPSCHQPAVTKETMNNSESPNAALSLIAKYAITCIDDVLASVKEGELFTADAESDSQ